jgi:hypothetical protein
LFSQFHFLAARHQPGRFFTDNGASGLAQGKSAWVPLTTIALVNGSYYFNKPFSNNQF